MKWLNYHHLIYFREIARLGTIAKASAHLRVGQPALSAQLKTFEDALGVELFERRNRKLHLTQVGKIILDYAEKIHEMGQELLQVAHERTFTKRIHLNVGSIDAIPKHLISDMLDFVHKKTGCFLSIREGDSAHLLRELLAHQLDVIISDQDLGRSGSRNVFSRHMIKLRASAFATQAFQGLKKNFPHSLNGAPAILPTGHSKLRLDLEHYCHLKGIYLDRVAETQDSMLQKILACKGDGVIFLPDYAAAELVTEEKLIRLGGLDQVYVDYYLVYSKRMIENPAVAFLLKQDFRKIFYKKISRQKSEAPA